MAQWQEEMAQSGNGIKESSGATEWHRLSRISFLFPWSSLAIRNCHKLFLDSCHLSPPKVHFLSFSSFFRFPIGRTETLILEY